MGQIVMPPCHDLGNLSIDLLLLIVRGRSELEALVDQKLSLILVQRVEQA